MSALLDIWYAVKHIVLTADPVTIAIALVVVLVAGLTLRGFQHLLNASVLALIAFALIKYLDGVLRLGHHAGALAARKWDAFASSQVIELLAYLLIFAVLIALVRAISSAVNK